MLKSFTALFLALSFCALTIFRPLPSSGQIPFPQAAFTPFRIGERLTYSVGFERFTNVAYVELQTVSRGKIGDTDAVELRSRIKTLDFVSAAFYLIDESRTVFASPDSGLPLYVSKIQNVGGLPKEAIQNHMAVPTVNFDLLTMVYKIRHSGGAGTLSLQENDKIYAVNFQTIGTERIKTDAGEFETSIVSVQSDYLIEKGLKDLRINLSSDESKIPAMIRLKTAKGEFKASVSSIQNVEPQVEPLPIPAPVKTPKPLPPPSATPRLYVPNQPLAPELSFELGESLEFEISSAGRPVGAFTLEARERKQEQGVDSLLLTATVTRADPGNRLFNLNDSMKAQVDPETLGPRRIDINFTGALSSGNQTAQFDEKTSVITFKGANRVDSPVGTHTILSLIYAIRSFNLKPSKDTSNPINDTRVAVFYETKPYVFTLRPSIAELITLQGEKVSAQMISISTGNPQLDSLNIKVWLSNDNRRLPMRFSVGAYQADLISEKNILPK